MHFTKVQISELMRKRGPHEPKEIVLECLMVAERREFLRDNPDNKRAIVIGTELFLMDFRHIERGKRA